CASGQIGCPVAWIHITHGDQKSRPGESHEFPPKGGCLWHGNGPMDFRQRNLTARPSPYRARSCRSKNFRPRHKPSELGKTNLFIHLSIYVNNKFLFVDTNNGVDKFSECETKSRFNRRLAVRRPWRTIWSASWNSSIPRDT